MLRNMRFQRQAIFISFIYLLNFSSNLIKTRYFNHFTKTFTFVHDFNFVQWFGQFSCASSGFWDIFYELHSKKWTTCSGLAKTALNNVLLPTLLKVVNNIVQHCYTRLQANSGSSTCSVLLTTLNNVGSKTLFNPVFIRLEQLLHFWLCRSLVIQLPASSITFFINTSVDINARMQLLKHNIQVFLKKSSPKPF